MRNFDRFVLRVVGGSDAADGPRLAVGGEVGMQLDHGAAGRDGICAVDLNLVISLRMTECRGPEQDEGGKKGLQRVSLDKL